MRVLITGGRAPVALDLARQFALAGNAVFVADSAPCFLARSSRAVTRAFRVPPPRQQPSAFQDAITAIVARESIDIIVPTCEEVFYLACFASRLRDRAELFCPDLDVLRDLHDKWRFSRLAASLGIDVPHSRLIQSRDDIAHVCADPEHIVLKPVFSRFAVHTLIRPTRMALAAVQPSSRRPWVAQRFIEGREFCTYSVVRDGLLRAHAAYRPAWRAGEIGSSYYFEPVDNSRAEAVVSRIVAELRYSGQISFDFIERPDGTVVVLECNPRATSGLHLFGPDDGLAASFGRNPARISRPASGPRMLAPAMLLLGGARALRRRQLRQFASDFRGARDALWSAGDPVPAFYLYVGLGAFVVQGLWRGVSPTTASTHDIEWDGERIA